MRRLEIQSSFAAPTAITHASLGMWSAQSVGIRVPLILFLIWAGMRRMAAWWESGFDLLDVNVQVPLLLVGAVSKRGFAVMERRAHSNRDTHKSRESAACGCGDVECIHARLLAGFDGPDGL